MLNQLISVKNLFKRKKQKTRYFVLMIHLVLNSFHVLDYSLVILMVIDLETSLVIQSVLCVHAELKVKLLEISSCVDNYAALKDYKFLKILRKLNQIF